MPGIFICYRRDDSPGHAGRLYSDLEEKFGASEVFFDRETIRPGVLFPDSLRQNLESCKVVLVVIGRDWQPERLHREGDYVYHEIAFALGHGKVVIPVLVENGAMPAAEKLPSALARFVHCQYVELNDALWRASVDDLAAKISHDYGIPLHRTEPAAPARWTEAAVRRVMRDATIALCLVLLALTFCAIAIRDDSAPTLFATKLLAAGGVFVMFVRAAIGVWNVRSSQR